MRNKFTISLPTIKEIYLTLIVVVNSGYMLQVSDSPLKMKIQYLTAITFGALLFDHFVMKKNFIKSDSMQTKFFIIAFSAIFSMIVNLEPYWIYVAYLAVVFIAFYIVNYQNNEKIASIFSNVMACISVISLYYLLRIKFFGIPNTTSMITAGISINEYYDYKIFFYPKLFISGIGRNSGIFWEPGVFSSFLLLSILIELCFKNKTSLIKISLFVLTLLTTRSTSGILLLFPILLLYLDKKIKSELFRIIMLFISWNIILLMLFFKETILQELVRVSPELFSKLVENGSTRSTRIMSPFLNYKIFKENPIFGAGLSGATKLFIANKKSYSADSQTSTTFAMLSNFGILGILYSIWWIEGIIKFNKFNKSQKAFLLFIIFVILNKEPHMSIMGTWIIFFMFLNDNNKINHLNYNNTLDMER